MKKTFYLVLIAGIFSLALFSCTSDSVNPSNTANITGHWVGQQSYLSVLTLKLDLNLTDISGVVGGTGTAVYTPAIGSQQTVNIPAVVGTVKDSTVGLTLTAIQYRGTLSKDGKTITGKATLPAALTGSTIIELDINLIKQ